MVHNYTVNEPKIKPVGINGYDHLFNSTMCRIASVKSDAPIITAFHRKNNPISAYK